MKRHHNGNGNGGMERAAHSNLLTVLSRGVNVIVAPLLVAAIVWASSSLSDMVRRQGLLESDLRVANIKLDSLAANHYTAIDAQRDNSLMSAKIENSNTLIKSQVDALKDRLDRLERQAVRVAPPVIRNGTRTN